MRGVWLGLSGLLCFGALAFAQTIREPTPETTALCPFAKSQTDGTPGPDAISGASDRFDALLGLAGDDRLTAVGHADCLVGGDGADVLTAAEGTYMFGDAGDDELVGAAEDEFAFGGPGNDRITLGSGFDNQYAQGGPGNDVMQAAFGQMHGDEGKDVLTGGRGPDRLIGDLTSAGKTETEADVLTGGGDSDVITAGPRDTVDGGADNDNITVTGSARVTGGTGNDRIDVLRSGARVNGGPGRDRIEARNGGRDTIDCGADRDRVVVDRADRWRNCEVVDVLPKIGLIVSPSSGTPNTRFNVSFVAPATYTDDNDIYFGVSARGSTESCSEAGPSLTARKGRRITTTIRPPRGGWCTGTLRIQVIDQYIDPSSKCEFEDCDSPPTVFASKRIRIR